MATEKSPSTVQWLALHLELFGANESFPPRLLRGPGRGHLPMGGLPHRTARPRGQRKAQGPGTARGVQGSGTTDHGPQTAARFLPPTRPAQTPHAAPGHRGLRALRPGPPASATITPASSVAPGAEGLGGARPASSGDCCGEEAAAPPLPRAQDMFHPPTAPWMRPHRESAWGHLV